MARLTLRRRATVAAAFAVALASLCVGAWGLREWKPFAHPSTAPWWPANVAPLARYVEDATHLRFTELVHVEFIAEPAKFRARTEPDDSPSDEARANAATDEAVGRALGFWTGDPHLADSAHTLRTSGDTGVEWLPDEHVVVVRAKDASASLSPIDRADLVLVLTEIVDEQHYGVARRLDEAATPQAFQALAGVAIGEAVWVHDRYVNRFNGDDADSYRADAHRRGTAFNDAVGEVNPTFRALRVASQTVGTAFVAAVQRTSGPAGVAQAFRAAVPDALDQMSLPVHKYFTPDPLEHVEPPAVPNGAEFVYTRQMGPFGVHLIAAGGSTPAEALEASDGWGNDAFLAYRLDGRICVDARIVADTHRAADHLEEALRRWGARRPHASEALVGRSGDTLLLSVCDPGASTPQPTLNAAAADQFLGRSILLHDQVTATGRAGVAECVAMGFFRRHHASDLRGDNPEVDAIAELSAIGHGCTTSV